MEIYWIIIILHAVICAWLSYVLVKQKGYDTASWAMAGFFFGVFGLIAAAGLPVKRENNVVSLTKKCPDCLETINTAASVCRYCGKKFNNNDIMPCLVENLKNGDADQHFLVIENFRRMKDTSVIPDVLDFIKTASIEYHYNWPKPLQSAAAFIIENEVEGIAPELISILNKTNIIQKKDLLLEMLGKIKDDAGIPILIEHLKENAHYQAEKSLISIGDKSIPALEKFGEEGKRSDKRLAEKIISQIKEYQEKGQG